MSEMVERVARAINVLTMSWSDDDEMVVRAQNKVREQARAAIKAMRQPTDGMIAVGVEEWCCTPDEPDKDVSSIWRAMATAALGEGE